MVYHLQTLRMNYLLVKVFGYASNLRYRCFKDIEIGFCGYITSIYHE